MKDAWHDKRFHIKFSRRNQGVSLQNWHGLQQKVMMSRPVEDKKVIKWRWSLNESFSTKSL